MRILALDISSHTGWSVLEDKRLLSYGQIHIPCKDGSWPLGIVAWAKDVASEIVALINKTPCDKIVIERANSSRFRKSQNFIDWFHYEIINRLVDEGHYSKVSYVDSAVWRAKCELKLSKEQKKQNKMAKKASSSGTKLKINGKIAGKITKKHLAILKTKELFNVSFKVKENDIAESILLGYSAFL